MKNIQGRPDNQSPLAYTLRMIGGRMKKIFNYINEISCIYFNYRGNLLARGIAYSLLVTIVPSLFLALYACSHFFTKSTAIQDMVKSQIVDLLPSTYSAEVMGIGSILLGEGRSQSMG